MNMQVCDRSGGVVSFLNVDVQEGRLEEAPEEGGDTQNCAGCLHKFLPKSTIKSSKAPESPVSMPWNGRVCSVH